MKYNIKNMFDFDNKNIAFVINGIDELIFNGTPSGKRYIQDANPIRGGNTQLKSGCFHGYPM